MNTPPPKPILTIDDLAERWTITAQELRRRMKALALPIVNIGSTKTPDLRFRLAAIQQWEASNEKCTRDEAEPVTPIPVGLPPELYKPTILPTLARRQKQNKHMRRS